jgi:hypothetical protein
LLFIAGKKTKNANVMIMGAEIKELNLLQISEMLVPG